MKARKEIKSKLAKKISPSTSYIKWLLPAVILVTAIAFYSSVNNGFTNWDDNANVTDNADLKAFRADNLGPALKNIFSIHQGILMYAPLVKLSYLIQFVEFQLNPRPYHLLNLILHLLNTVLVFCFVWLLCRQQYVAFITALLFSIHPMHVESVAWITGRIDVLYSFFYLAALCTYLLYLKHEKWRWQLYVLALFLFVLALFTKASAVTLPVVFFMVDYFWDRRITTKTVLVKAPFLVLSFIFGCIAIYVQQGGVVLREGIGRYNLFDRGLFICYAPVEYLWKLVVPVNLACIYDYPLKHPSHLFQGFQMYPFVFYMAPLIIITIAFLVYKSQQYGKDVLFAFSFFFVNILLALPGFASRDVIIADRYTYISYIGLFFILARWLAGIWENKTIRFQSLKTPSIAALTLFLAWCCYLTAQRCNVWHDSITLWSDAININPGSAVGYNDRGYEYNVLGKNEEAIKDLNTAILLNPKYVEAYSNLSNAYLGLGKNELAIKECNSAILIDPKAAEAYNNRGYAYNALNQYNEAIKDYNIATLLKPNYVGAYNNRGNAYVGLKQYEEAIKDYSTAIRLDPGYVQAYNNRGVAYFAIQKYQLALDDALKAKQLGFNIDAAIINSIEAKINVTAQ